MASGRFMNDLFLVTNPHKIPGVKVLENTSGGNDANLWERSWMGSKGKRLLAYTCHDEDEYVVTDIIVVPEDKDRENTDEYAGLLLTKDSNEKGLKKHIIYFKRDLRSTATKAVEQIMVLNPGKGEMLPPMFTSVSHPINELVIAFKMAELPKATAVIPEAKQQQQLLTNAPPLAGIEGIPFQINPKYNLNQNNSSDPIVSSMFIISVADIESKYNYAFTTENKVAQEGM